MLTHKVVVDEERRDILEVDKRHDSRGANFFHFGLAFAFGVEDLDGDVREALLRLYEGDLCLLGYQRNSSDPVSPILSGGGGAIAKNPAAFSACAHERDPRVAVASSSSSKRQQQHRHGHGHSSSSGRRAVHRHHPHLG